MRSQWVDIAKGIAISAVVLFHISYSFPNLKLLPVTALFGYAWHVPVFFLIGGFFIKEEKLVRPVSFIRGKSNHFIGYYSIFTFLLCSCTMCCWI